MFHSTQNIMYLTLPNPVNLIVGFFGFFSDLNNKVLLHCSRNVCGFLMLFVIFFFFPFFFFKTISLGTTKENILLSFQTFVMTVEVFWM